MKTLEALFPIQYLSMTLEQRERCNKNVTMTLGVFTVKHVKNLRGTPSLRRETNVCESFSVAESDKMKTEWGHGHLPNVPLVFFNTPPQNEVVSELSGLPVERRLEPCFQTEAMIAGP